MMQRKKITFLILILLAFALCTVLILLANRAKASDIVVQDGTLDLSQWNGETVLSLSGDWDFYWNRFLDENNLSNNPTTDLKVKLPSVWNGLVVDGTQLGGMGYATYRLHVTGAEAGIPLAMRIIPFSSAYEMYVDDNLIAASGKISTLANGFLPQYVIQTVTFTPKNGEFDIILHISNFVYARGGAWNPICFGNSENINHMSQLIFGMDFFITGCLLLISSHCLFLFFLRRDKGHLLFLALCVIFIGRTIISGNYLINVLFSSGRYLTIILIDYITLYWLPGLSLCMGSYMYPREISRGLIKALLIYAAGMTVLTLILPVKIFSNFIFIAEGVAFGAGIYGVVKMVLLSVRRQPEAFIVFIGVTALTLCISYDVLYENNIIRIGFTEYSPIGFLILASLIQCMFWVRYDRSIRENERVLLELNEADKREQKLEMQFLKSQIRPHFINNSLNAIISISRTDADKSRKLLVEFSKYLRNCYRVKDLDDKVPIENELSFVRAYVALEQARFSDSLYVDYDVDNIFLMVPPLSLQPLVENAIVHGVREKSGDGHLLIYVKDCGGFVKVGVWDDGVGVDPKLVSALLSNEHQGEGIGIYNINRRMKKLYNTGLYIEPRPEGGTNAYIVIPKEEKSCCEPY